jgi:hypothetical protein
MHRLLVLGCCSAALAAQQVVRTAHPQDTLQNTSGNLAPLGVFASGLGAEARAHMLLRAVELPGPGAQLVGIEVQSQSAVSLRYSLLSISVAPTTATALLPVFSANMAAPHKVLHANNLTVPYAAGAWSVIPFAAPYAHDGTSALVLEFKKIVDPNSIVQTVMATPSPPPRSDRPAMVWSFGGIGSGASNAATALASGDPLAVRLLWTGAPTMRHRSDVGPGGNQYGLGTTIHLTIEGAPGALFMTAIDFGFLPVPLPMWNASGQLYVQGHVIGTGTLDAAGTARQTKFIPPDPLLLGLHVTYQAGTLDLLASQGQLSNAHDHFVNQ